MSSPPGTFYNRGTDVLTIRLTTVETSQPAQLWRINDDESSAVHLRIHPDGYLLAVEMNDASQCVPSAVLRRTDGLRCEWVEQDCLWFPFFDGAWGVRHYFDRFELPIGGSVTPAAARSRRYVGFSVTDASSVIDPGFMSRLREVP